jgi:hypothetical protein
VKQDSVINEEVVNTAFPQSLVYRNRRVYLPECAGRGAMPLLHP